MRETWVKEHKMGRLAPLSMHVCNKQKTPFRTLFNMFCIVLYRYICADVSSMAWVMMCTYSLWPCQQVICRFTMGVLASPIQKYYCAVLYGRALSSSLRLLHQFLSFVPSGVDHKQKHTHSALSCCTHIAIYSLRKYIITGYDDRLLIHKTLFQR